MPRHVLVEERASNVSEFWNHRGCLKLACNCLSQMLCQCNEVILAIFPPHFYSINLILFIPCSFITHLIHHSCTPKIGVDIFIQLGAKYNFDKQFSPSLSFKTFFAVAHINFFLCVLLV